MNVNILSIILVAIFFFAISEWLKKFNGPFISYLISAIFSVIATLILQNIPITLPHDTDSSTTSTFSVSYTPAENPEQNEMIETAFSDILAPANDFLFPESSTEYLSNDRLNQLMKSSDKYAMRSFSQRAINEIFARYGYTFTGTSQTAQEARNRFEGKDWYEKAQSRCPVNPGEQETLLYDYFNDYERTNVKNINQWQIDNKLPDLYD